MHIQLSEVLQAREDRVRFQQHLLQTHRCPLICFTMNIAGPVKTSGLIERGFRVGLRELKRSLPSQAIVDQRIEYKSTGPQAFLSVQMPAEEIKSLCVKIEDATPLGRLFDMDVLDSSGKKLQRDSLRGCIVCGAAGRGCAARRVHPVSELQAVTAQLLQEHFKGSDAEQIAATAVRSLLDEVHTTPKPGLVDRRNNGSHTDMDIRHFIASAHSLRPYFQECVQIGQDTATHLPQETFSLLRQAGLRAEQTMYSATGGVNTHKGVIYTLGVLCGSIGRLWSAESPIPENAAITSECARMVSSSVDSDFASADGSTAGLQLYRQYGIQGIRGEVAAGLPSVIGISLPAYKDGLSCGLSPNDAGAVALLHLIAQVQDTNLYRRGGCAGAAWAAQAAQRLLQAAPYPPVPSIAALDDSFIAKNLSPGGCADLLAVTYFLHSLNP